MPIKLNHLNKFKWSLTLKRRRLSLCVLPHQANVENTFRIIEVMSAEWFLIAWGLDSIDVSNVTFVTGHLLHIGRGAVLIQPAVLLYDVTQCLINIFSHTAGITAYVEVRTLL